MICGNDDRGYTVHTEELKGSSQGAEDVIHVPPGLVGFSPLCKFIDLLGSHEDKICGADAVFR